MRCKLALMFLALAGVLSARPQKAETPPAPTPAIQALIDQGKAIDKKREYEKAIAAFEDAFKQAQTLNDVAGQAACMSALGVSHYELGELAKALECFHTAELLFTKVGNAREAMGMVMDQGVVNDNSGHPDKALPMYEQALKMSEALQDKHEIANCLLNIAILYENQDEFQKVLDYGQRARTLYRELKDPEWEGSSLQEISYAYQGLGQMQKAMDALTELIAITNRPGTELMRAKALAHLARVIGEQGQPLKALQYFNEALKIERELRNIRSEASTLDSMGTLYDLMGQRAAAIDCISQALAIAEKTGDRPTESYALGNLGILYHAAGDNARARVLLEKSLALARDMKDRSGAVSNLTSLATVFSDEHKYADAIELLTIARSELGGAHRLEYEGTILDDLGLDQIGAGRYAEGLANIKRALVLLHEQKNEVFVANTTAHLALAEVRIGHLDEAEADYRTSIAMTEKARSDLGENQDAKQGFISERIGQYREFAALLVRRRKPEEAFNVAQKAKARVLLDLMQSGKVDVQQEMTSAERAKEKELRDACEILNAQIVREGAVNAVGGKKRTAILKDQLVQAEARLSEFRSSLYIQHPELARKRTTHTVSLTEMGHDLPSDTALLEYVSGDWENLLLVVTSDRGIAKVTAYPLTSDGSVLANQCLALRAVCSDPGKEWRTQATRLYAALIAPAANLLSHKKRWVICPDGPLWNVPFDVLTLAKGPLAQKYEIDYAYSATGFDAIWHHRRATHNKSMLVLANPDFGTAQRFGDNPLIPGQRPIETASRPIETASRPIETASRDLTALNRAGIVDLPGTQSEADAICRLFPGATSLTRDKAQESAFKRIAGQYGYVHIASHAFFNDASPMLSSIVLAQPKGGTDDGYLTAREIFDLDLHAQLVVLSACNTARGEENSGEGIVGMSWALFAAGVPSQVISQWSVDDKATAALMTSFYTNIKHGQSKGAALRNASLGMGKLDAKWKHPYYWAPFILMGDWR